MTHHTWLGKGYSCQGKAKLGKKNMPTVVLYPSHGGWSSPRWRQRCSQAPNPRAMYAKVQVNVNAYTHLGKGGNYFANTTFPFKEETGRFAK